KSLVGALILFILKKNNLYFYINYKSFNKISIKNYYSLFFISEIFNRVINSKYFLKINIKDTIKSILKKKINRR
ncbi:uncharacterized protein BO80DRAFT_366361, partial [Aspergillus ibericus CBS 121593]